MRSNIREGGTFPDYELTDQSGKRRSLSELEGGNPMVLHLSRGGFDPKEHQLVRRLADACPGFRNAYTRLVLISTTIRLNINEFRDALGATWPFLSDPDRVVQKDLDIKEFTDERHDPMIPHTFVIEPGLKIFKGYNGYWYWVRPTVTELYVDLRAVFQVEVNLRNPLKDRLNSTVLLAFSRRSADSHARRAHIWLLPSATAMSS